MSFWGEIKRRKIFQVAVVYGVVAWLLVQIVTAVDEPLHLPSWTATLVIVLLAVGFPITLVMSWAFNLTSEGLVRDRGGSGAPRDAGRTIEYVLIGLLIVAVGWIAYRVDFSGAPSAGASSAAITGARGRLPNSVAVLPFASLSLDPADALFAAGIHDELLNRLAHVRDLNVIARTSGRSMT
jgi:hypothetical protein